MSTPQTNSPSVQGGPVSKTVGTYRSLHVYASVLNVTLGALFFGYMMSDFNPIQAFVKVHAFDKPVPKILITLMTSFIALGAGLGAITAGKIASAFGRRKPIMIIDVISIFGTVLTLLPNEYCLLFGRLIQGYCVGANSSLVPLYINEVAPTEITGKLGTFNQLLIAAGGLLAPLVGLSMPDGNGDSDPDNENWRVELGIAGIFPLLRLFLTLFVFRQETPKYLLNINDEAGAVASLNYFYTEDRVPNELAALKEQKEIQSRAGQVKLRQIVGPKYRKRLIVGVIVSMLQQLSGINAIIFFSNIIFSTGNNAGTNKPTIYTIIMDILQVIGVLAAGAIIERLGRRFLLIFGMAFSAVCLGAFGILGVLDPTSPVGKFFIWAYMLAFGFTLGPLPWVYISDILPDVGIGIGSLANWLIVFLIGMIMPEVQDGGLGWSFIFFACCSLLGTIFMLFYVKETTGKSEAQISAMFGYKGDVHEHAKTQNIEAVKTGAVERQNSEADSLKSDETASNSEKAKAATNVVVTVQA